MLSIVLGSLALLSLGLMFWQWLEGRLFPLHRRAAETTFSPAVTLLKPLKGGDAETAACLRSWLAQDYAGPMQVLFGVASADDPVCATVNALLREFPHADAELVVCSNRLGVNAKVSKLAQLAPRARHGVLVISDADVRVPPDFLANLVAPLRDPGVGLVNPFYQLANPATTVMRWEALAVNADFWTSVLQSCRLGPMRFALGAVMAVRRKRLAAIGGFSALANHLADDYELGRRVAADGAGIALCPVVAECREAPQGWAAIWRHQLRWARTIRVCQPLPYAFSLVTNVTLWTALWWLSCPTAVTTTGAAVALVLRVLTAADTQRRLIRSSAHLPWCWLAVVKDLLQAVLWALSFLGQTVEWRGERYRVTRRGELVRIAERNRHSD
jgi:ceramide glucosyltransferase